MLTVVGGVLYFGLRSGNYGSDRTEIERNPAAVQGSLPQTGPSPSRPASPSRGLSQPQRPPETSRSPWERDRGPRGHIKSFRLRRKVAGWSKLVKGRVSRPTRDAEPRLLVHSILDGTFLDYRLIIDSKGNFKTKLTFGFFKAGEEIILLLVFTARSTKFHGVVDELPAGVRVLDQRKVLRK